MLTSAVHVQVLKKHVVLQFLPVSAIIARTAHFDRPTDIHLELTSYIGEL
jgi:hypothetical protein